MRAVDGGIVLVCASEGIMPQTETVLRQALRERVKPTLFINKVDRLIKELQLTPEAMQERFIKIITEVNNLIDRIAEPEIAEKWHVNVMNGSVSFGSAFHNWGMSIPFMKKKGLSFKEVIDAYQGTAGDEWKALAKKAPVHECVLNMVIQHLPDPETAQKNRIPKIWRGDLETEQGKALVNCDPNGPVSFIITKVVVDPQAGEISAGRLYAGTMKKGIEVSLLNAKTKARIQQVFIYNGAKRSIIDEEPFEQIKHLFEPVVTKSIEAKSPSDLPKLIEVLRQVQKEDPCIKVEINEETGEHLIRGMGELHLEAI